MRTASIEFSKYNINVNRISPGKIYHEQTLTRENPRKNSEGQCCIAAMSLFLVSEKADNITGQNFIIDGGQSFLGVAHIR
jgi:NAD(P)-dependent dehydrogenase (short-subunit alcohol dehydrogenase family)